MNLQILEKHLLDLSYVYLLEVEDDFKSFIVRDFPLPPGYNKTIIDIRSDIPPDYPESSLGVGDSYVYVPTGLKFHRKKLADYHEDVGPRGWAWWCYEEIDWDPCRDNLITFFEVMRTHMTNPD